MINFTHKELEPYYTWYMFANIPGYLYRHIREEFVARSDTDQLDKETIENLIYKATDGGHFYSRLALCLASFLNDLKYIESLENRFSYDPWHKFLYELVLKEVQTRTYRKEEACLI